MAGAIGTGKSTAAALHNLYVSVHLYLMRNPKKFFGLAPSTSIVQAFISFSMDKARFDTTYGLLINHNNCCYSHSYKYFPPRPSFAV